MRRILFCLLVLFGAFMLVYGEYDDSPGGQFLGLVAVVAGALGAIRGKKKNPN